MATSVDLLVIVQGASTGWAGFAGLGRKDSGAASWNGSHNSDWAKRKWPCTRSRMALSKNLNRNIERHRNDQSLYKTWSAGLFVVARSCL